MASKKVTPFLDKTPLLYSKDFYKWPDSWMGFDEDLMTGNIILQGYLPFIQNLVDAGFAKKTIKKHMDNLWFLGSEIIRGVHFNKKERKLLSKELLLEYVHEAGGPSVHQWNSWDEMDQSNIKSYRSTCRKLFNFLKQSN